jgi:mannosyl-3-phosphoglycerate phosphatase
VGWLVFTDLDGTLLDPATYAWEPARPALEALRAAGVPVILNSSKTRAEIEALRREMNHADPFIVENGAALFAPRASVPLDAARRVDGYQVLEWGTAYATIVRTLEEAARQAGVHIRGFHDMGDEEVAECTGLPLDRARLARQREYDEPFVVLDPDPAARARLAAAVEQSGLRLTRGNRFCHLLGSHDKAAAARATADAYGRHFGAVRTIALGDAPNDIELLEWADVAIILGSPDAPELSTRLPSARRRPSGPAGWNEAILELVAESRESARR